MTSGPTAPAEGDKRPDDMIGDLGKAQTPSDEAAPSASGAARAEAEEAKPRTRRRDGALVGYLSGVFTLLTLATLAVGGAFYWGKTVFDRPGPLQQDTTVMVQRNQGVTEIADNLARAGVIDDANIFKLGVAAYGAKDKLRFGEYAFPARVSMREAMEIIVSGKSIEHVFTVPEGLTSLQIVERLRDQPLLTGEVKETPAEGALLPETYKFTRGDSREKMIARMRQHREEIVERVWRERDPESTLKSVDELVTLASLVEKETGIAEERPRVAAVFANRLARGMRLQSDPTIVYGLVGGRGTLGRSLTRADIQSRTPYNTYVVPGLPAGPIANPGRDALEAAARPAKTRDLYFVADGSGGHAFAPTLAEHNRNVANWRRIEKARGVPPDRLAPDEQTPEAASDGAEAANPPPTPAAANGSSPPKSANDRRRPRER